jgi:hypothetical protein
MKQVAIVVTVAIAALLGSSALAADMAVKAPPPPLPPFQDWSGIYVGLEGGHGWGKQSTGAISPGDQFSPVILDGITPFQLPPPPLFFAVPSINQKGWLFGGFFGAQKQWGNWVLGIEGDIDGSNIRGSGTAIATSVTSNEPRLCDLPRRSNNHAHAFLWDHPVLHPQPQRLARVQDRCARIATRQSWLVICAELVDLRHRRRSVRA